MTEIVDIRPQPGPQEAFLSTIADIAFYGGGAGGGKTYALLIEPLRHRSVPGFNGITFRRTTPQIRNKGGLWDQSMDIYPLVAGKPKQHTLEWNFQGNSSFKFNHMEQEKNVYDHQGAQYCYMAFDELTHFTEFQFFYMLSRNRSTCGVPPYVRAGCNPDPDSWVAQFISWWIDPETGFAIVERAGVLRWFIREENIIHWGDTREELVERYGPEVQPKSVTFIPASVYDNKILLERDPAYLSNLMALPYVERARLLDCNWKVRPAAGNVFKREWFTVVDHIPDNITSTIRYWDLAATEPTKENKQPCYTAGCKMAKLKDGEFIILHMARFRKRPKETEDKVRHFAETDGDKVKVRMEQEPGSSGKYTIANFKKLLKGYPFGPDNVTGSKLDRANPLSAKAESKKVFVLRGEWNEPFFDEAEMFPDGTFKDQVDAASGAYKGLSTSVAVAVSAPDMEMNNRGSYRLRGNYRGSRMQ
jgi:predicted phage terminase large subunit-like protein